MAASRGWEGPPRGSQPTLSGSKTVSLKSIGTSCRTRRPRPSLSAAFPCLATHSPKASRKKRARPQGDTLLTDQGGTSHDFTRCFERHVCDFGGEREHRLDHRRFLAIEGQEGARRGARCGATTSLCGQRGRSVHS